MCSLYGIEDERKLLHFIGVSRSRTVFCPRVPVTIFLLVLVYPFGHDAIANQIHYLDHQSCKSVGSDDG